MTNQGQEWLRQTSICLQEKLYARLNDGIFKGDTRKECKTLKREILIEHSSCYVEAGFCELSLNDRFKIAETLSAKEWFDPASWEVILKLNRECRK